MNPNTPFLELKALPSPPLEGTEIDIIPVDSFLPLGMIIALLIGGYFFIKNKI